MQIINRFLIAIENGMLNCCLFLIKQNKHLRTFASCRFFSISIYDLYFGLFKIHSKLTQLAVYRSHKWKTKMFATQLKFFHLFSVSFFFERKNTEHYYL